jgi:N-acetyltransferase 10
MMLTMVQIVNLDYLLHKRAYLRGLLFHDATRRILGLPTHRKKRESKIKQDVERGIREPNEQNPFEML